MPDPPMTHAGWLREADGPWRHVCSARSEADCWQILLERRTTARRVERVVLRMGEHPEEGRRW